MKEKVEEHPLRVGLISLGCAKNLVDAEIMLGTLLKEGVEITNDAAQADVVIVNTCSFIDSAQEESVDAILESAEVRKAHNRGQGLIVSGCMTQRFPEELPKLLPEIDAFMGIDQVANVTSIVKKALAHRQGRLSQGKVRRASSRADGNGPPPQRLTGTLAPPALVEINTRPQYIPDYATPRFRLTPRQCRVAGGCDANRACAE